MASTTFPAAVASPTTPAVTADLASLGLPAVRGDEDLVARVLRHPLPVDQVATLCALAQGITVTDEFRAVVQHFGTPAGHTPAGFRVELALTADGTLAAGLVRDISYDADGARRPTSVLFSADSANPYEVAPAARLLSNLTCNPGIIYDLFLNDPQANVGGVFKDRDEVMTELGSVLGPGCDISVELNDPFEQDLGKVLDEAARFREILSPWRVVIKVPHTGPVNADNVGQLMAGDKRLDRRYTRAATEDALRRHNLALTLREHGYRVNFTLMFEPYQTQLALQARPYFINSFVRHRLVQTQRIAALAEAYRAGQDVQVLEDLRGYLLATDYLGAGEGDLPLGEVWDTARRILDQRRFHEPEGADGLDGVRHNLRVLRQANLPDTRLIICSMEGEQNYPDIDRLLTEPELADLAHKVVVTAEPGYLARFTSANQVVSYQRRFMNAAAGQA